MSLFNFGKNWVFITVITLCARKQILLNNQFQPLNPTQQSTFIIDEIIPKKKKLSMRACINFIYKNQ